MAAVYSKIDFVALLDADIWVNRLTFKRFCHIVHAGMGKRTVIFAKMAAKSPFFINIYTFHTITIAYLFSKAYFSVIIRLHALCRGFRALFH